jgi:hypothetical protein
MAIILLIMNNFIDWRNSIKKLRKIKNNIFVKTNLSDYYLTIYKEESIYEKKLKF